MILNRLIRFGDKWKFDGQNWIFWNGPQQNNTPPVYGPLKTFSESYHPGSRGYETLVVSPTGEGVYIIGGLNANNEAFSDIWKFDYEKGWAWWGGQQELNVPSQPGIKRVPSSNNVLGSRFGPNAVMDEEGNIWIQGGVDAIKESGPPGIVIRIKTD